MRAPLFNPLHSYNKILTRLLLCIILCSYNTPVFAQIISTITGTGKAGFSGDGDLAYLAKVSFPYGVATDMQGNIYFCDTNNGRVRKVDVLSGNISTIAGGGIYLTGQAATSCYLASPTGVAVDASGNIYIADLGGGSISRIDAASGILNIIAGRTAGLPYISTPVALALDKSNNLYIADAWSCIRKLDLTTNEITTIAGAYSERGFSGDGGPATSAKLSSPTGMAFDSRGNLYFSDSYNHRVRKINAANGIITTIAGNGIAAYTTDGLLATANGMYFPEGIAIDKNDNLYVIANYSNVRKITLSDGKIYTVVNSVSYTTSLGDGNLASQASLSSAKGLALDPTGNLYIGDTENQRIRKVIGLVNPIGNDVSVYTYTPNICRDAKTMPLTYKSTAGNPDSYTISGAGVLPDQTGSLTSISGDLTIRIDPQIFTGNFIIKARNTKTGVSATALRVVNFYETPTITVNPITLTACTGQTVYIQAQGGQYYYWSTGVSGERLALTPYQTTSISVTGYNYGCPASATAIVTVKPAPSITNVVVSGPLIPNVQTTVSLSVLAATTTGARFMFKGPNSFSAQNNTGVISVTTAGQYSVTLVETNGCSTQAVREVISSTCTHPDFGPLIELYNATNGPNWAKRTGWLTNCDPCSGWEGVTCTGGRVTGLYLASNKMTGSLPASIGNLTALRSINLTWNALSGSIPGSIGLLKNLEDLDFGHNDLSGTIPPAIGELSSLTLLVLERNSLAGSIPPELGNLTKLRWIQLNENLLTGELPATIGNLKELKYLYFEKNKLSGSIPESIGSLANLQILKLYTNKLTGQIPESIYNLKNLRLLALNDNFLSGGISSKVGSLTLLSVLGLSSNQLSGPIPESIKNLTYLFEIQLSNNKLDGKIPLIFDNLPYLEVIYLNNNLLEGCLPVALKKYCGSSQICVDLAGNSGLPNNGDWVSLCSTGAGSDKPVIPYISSSSVCIGETISLSATGANSYTWIPSTYVNLSNNITGTFVTATIAKSGLHQLTLLANKGGSCTTSASVNLSGLERPELSLSVQYNCNKTSDLSVRATGVNLQYFFSGPNGFNTSNTTGSISVSTTGIYSVSVLNTVSGCTSSTTILVTVNSLPAVSISASAVMLCRGQTTTLSASGAAAYRWSTGETTASITVGPASSSTYALTGISSNGCSATASTDISVSLCQKPIKLVEPDYDCYTGSFVFKTQDGDGSLIIYSLNGFINSTTATGPHLVRPATDTQSLTLIATQNGQVATYSWDWRGYCLGKNLPPITTGLQSQTWIAGEKVDYPVSQSFRDPDNETLRFNSSSLPEGLSLSPAGTISGNPTQTGLFSITVTATDPHGWSVSTVFTVHVIQPREPAPLSLSAVIESCNTGRLVIRFIAGGGSGAVFEYFGVGVTPWTTNAGPHSVDVFSDSKPLMLFAREKNQGAKIVSYTLPVPACAIPQNTTITNPPVETNPEGLSITGASVNCQTRLVTITISESDTRTVEQRILLVTNYIPFSSQLILDEGVFGERKPVYIQVRQGNRQSSLFWFDFAPQCPVTPSIPTLPTSNTNIQECVDLTTSQPLSLTAHIVCKTTIRPYQLFFISTGGIKAKNSVIEFMSPGLTGWTGKCMVEFSEGEPVYSIWARQRDINTNEILQQTSILFPNPCLTSGREGQQTSPELSVMVLGNPTIQEEFEVKISGVSNTGIELLLIDSKGTTLTRNYIDKEKAIETQKIRFNGLPGVYFLNIISAGQKKVVKLVKQ